MLTEKQLKQRKIGLGGTDAACLLGYGFKTPMQIYFDKTKDELEPQPQNNAMYFGSRLESFVVEEYEKQTGNNCAIEENLLIHPIHKFMIGNIDRRIKNQNKILECKTAGFKSDQWGEPGTDQIPKAYLVQCAHYAVVCDVDSVDIAVFFLGDREFAIYHYDRNEKLENKLIEIEKDFWENHVLPKIPPEATTLHELKRRWIKADNEQVKMASPQLLANIERLQEIKNIEKELESEKDRLQFSICSNLQDASILIDQSGEVLATWKNQKSTRLDAAELKKSHPEIYKQFTKSSEYRVFRVK